MNEKRGQQIDEMGAKNRGGQFYVYKGEGDKIQRIKFGGNTAIESTAEQRKEINVCERKLSPQFSGFISYSLGL